MDFLTEKKKGRTNFRGKPLNGYPDSGWVRSKPITASIYQVSLLIFCEIP
jgi:hypothetical protein